jgi:hypothetical protein
VTIWFAPNQTVTLFAYISDWGGRIEFSIFLFLALPNFSAPTTVFSFFTEDP